MDAIKTGLAVGAGTGGAVDLICAYLRMPYAEPPSPDIPSDSSPEESDEVMKAWLDECRTDEHFVREAAEDVLTRHLKQRNDLQRRRKL